MSIPLTHRRGSEDIQDQFQLYDISFLIAWAAIDKR